MTGRSVINVNLILKQPGIAPVFFWHACRLLAIHAKSPKSYLPLSLNFVLKSFKLLLVAFLSGLKYKFRQYLHFGQLLVADLSDLSTI